MEFVFYFITVVSLSFIFQLVLCLKINKKSLKHSLLRAIGFLPALILCAIGINYAFMENSMFSGLSALFYFVLTALSCFGAILCRLFLFIKKKIKSNKKAE